MPDLATDTALLARSVLSCPERICLRVGGSTESLEDQRYDVTCDVHGVPVFSAAEDSLLLEAARSGSSALLEVTSGLGSSSSPERHLGLVLSGQLVQRESGCTCCGDPRSLIALELDAVTLYQSSRAVPVDVRRFHDRRHVLNRGYLQRTTEHANDAHEHELRTAVASLAGLPIQSLLAASIVEVDPCGVEVSWLDAAGAHTRRLEFAEPAASPQELGSALRSHLHAGMC